MKRVVIFVLSGLLLLSGAGASLGATAPPSPAALILTVEAEQGPYEIGAEVVFVLRLENTGSAPVTLHFNSGRQYDISVRGPDGYFWRWSAGRAFIDMLTEISLQPGESKEFREVWETQWYFQMGAYSVIAGIVAQEGQLEAETEVLLMNVMPPIGPRVAFLADLNGDVIIASTTNDQTWSDLQRMMGENLTLWVGGKVEKTDNPPWHFRFAPDSLLAADVTASGLQAADLRTIEGELDYWTGLGTAYIQARVLGISPLPFPDVLNHWAFPAIITLYHLQIVDGYPDGSFQPERSITRAEFAKMILLAAGLLPEASPTPSFSDLSSGHWAYAYVEAAAKAKLFLGFPDGTFRPEDPVSKEQVVTVLVRKVGWTLSEPTSPTFSDLPAESWAAPFVETAVQEGLFDPNDPHLAGDLFQGNLPATRAQISVLLGRLLFQFERKAENVILRADSGGGLVPIEFFRQHVSAFHLYGDGTVIAFRNGPVLQANLTYPQSLDLILVLTAWGYLQMDDHYQPDPMPTDLGTTSIDLWTADYQKAVSEYAWGAPAEFHYLYSYLKNVYLPEAREYIPARSTLFVTTVGKTSDLSVDQKERLVTLPAAFLAGVGRLADLASKPEGISLTGELYTLIAPLLAAHQRVIFAEQEGLAYSLIAKIPQPYSGIYGRITLGPIQPVEIPGQPNEKPYQATVVVRQEASGQEVARFQSDVNGYYRIALAPGAYQLDPLPGANPFPVAGLQTVVVPEGQFVEVNFQYDTAIR
ncbi:MAG: S-layer homology domain-containing protein [Coprothermobacterota bacterium]|nr:S-layer homology domain-containing protein [Coprothermobacterota bacterium]